MKKLFFLAILITGVTLKSKAQSFCTDTTGIFSFYPTKSSLRMGEFPAPNNNVDSINCLSAAFGYNTKAKGYASFAINNNTVTTGEYSFAAGSSTTASGQNSISGGFGTLASGPFSTAMGYSSQATGSSSMATGYLNKATGDRSFVVGGQNEASTYDAVAVGYNNKASGSESFAGGMSSLASGLRSFCVGDNSVASNYLSFAMGGNSTSSGINAFSLGYYSQASGNYSVALGSYAYARAADNFAAGKGIITKAMNGTAIGTYNDSTDTPNPLVFGATDRIFQVGIGGPSTRQNAMTILRNGNIGVGVLNPAQKLEVSGSVKFTGNLLVQTDKGIIRSNDATQQKKVTSSFTLSGTTFLAGETKSFPVTWSESFGGTPDAFVGNITGGSGGWAEVVMSLTSVSSTGATLYIYNARGVAVTPNFTVKIVAIGAQ